MDQQESTEAARARFAAKLREVEDDLAMLRGARERMVAAGVVAQRQLDETTGTLISRTSEDGTATVVCNGLGKVQRVTLDETVYNKLGEQEVCDAVKQARQLARETARRHHATSGSGHAARR
ncbi:YbaB/EbfC family nucleoid-associated protein [Stackebrandtia soli]|uniref:YbaB/EbfC family nucleoid-associated protein n=1 Tax=Stackebrandtia soli TaxID=1892856 RepID=UPI0039EA35AC